MSKTIYICDTIGHGGILAKDVIKQLNRACMFPKKIRINSPGGEVFEGMAIYNAIKKYEGKTITHIEGMVYGIASIIALACDIVWMKRGAYFVISDPTIMTTGSTKEMEDASQCLDKVRHNMAEILAQRSNLTKGEILEMMERETWLTDKGAEINGFVDWIYE